MTRKKIPFWLGVGYVFTAIVSAWTDEPWCAAFYLSLAGLCLWMWWARRW